MVAAHLLERAAGLHQGRLSSGPRMVLPLALVALLSVPAVWAETAALQVCPQGAEPRAVVARYLEAMRDRQFPLAYEFVTDNVTDGRPRIDWSALQARAFKHGEVEIYGVDVRDPRPADSDPECAAVALVPNILSAKDKLNVDGSIEFEIYTVRHDAAHGWRIDAQETLYETRRIVSWFPDIEIVEVSATDP